MSKYPKRSPEETLRRQQQKADDYLARVIRAVDRLKPHQPRRRRYDALFGVRGCLADLRLCDVAARKAGAGIFVEVVGGLEATFQMPNVTFRHITLIDRLGATSDRNPIMRVRALRRKVDKAIRRLGLSGLVFIEVQPLLNYPAGGHGRTLLLHAHALCWGVTSRREFRDAMQGINKSRSWQNEFGATPVKARRLKTFDDVLRIACYIAKLPHDGKIRVPTGGGDWRFRPVLKGYPDRLALRIGEGLSHYSVFDAVFSIGGGRLYRLEWKRRLVKWHKARLNRPGMGLSFDVEAFWRRGRSSRLSGYEKPFVHE